MMISSSGLSLAGLPFSATVGVAGLELSFEFIGAIGLPFTSVGVGAGCLVGDF